MILRARSCVLGSQKKCLHANLVGQTTQRRCCAQVQRTRLFDQAPRTKTRSLNLAFKEQEDLLHAGHVPIDWESQWPGHNDSLRMLFFNKHYGHAIDYFHTLREHGPKPDTETYNIFFAIQEQIGTPYEVLDYFEDFSPDNPFKVTAQPDATTFGFVIKAHLALKDLDSALKVFEDCKARGITPTTRTVSCIIDYCADTGNTDSSLHAHLLKEASVYEEQTEKPDTEFLNSVLFLRGRKNLRSGEDIFRRICESDDLEPNYNTYQRLLEMYLVHKVTHKFLLAFADMKSKGYQPNDLTKYTVFQAFVTTGDRRILFAIQSTWPREMYDLDHHVKYFKDWLYNYRTGGGPVPVPDELLQGRDVQTLEKTYIAALFEATGGKHERLPPLFDTHKNVSGYSQLIDAEVLDFEKGVTELVDHELHRPDPRSRTDVNVQPMGRKPPTDEELDKPAERNPFDAMIGPAEWYYGEELVKEGVVNDEMIAELKSKRKTPPKVWTNPLLETPEYEIDDGKGEEQTEKESSSEDPYFDGREEDSDAAKLFGTSGKKSSSSDSESSSSTEAGMEDMKRQAREATSYDDDEGVTQTPPELEGGDDEMGGSDDEEDGQEKPLERVHVSEEGDIYYRVRQAQKSFEEENLLQRKIKEIAAEKVKKQQNGEIDSDEVDDSEYCDPNYQYLSKDPPAYIDEIPREDVKYFENHLTDMEIDFLEKSGMQKLKMGAVRHDIDKELKKLKTENPDQTTFDNPMLQKLRHEYSQAKHEPIEIDERVMLKDGLETYLNKLKMKSPHLYEKLYHEYRSDVFGDSREVTEETQEEPAEPNPVDILRAQSEIIDEYLGQTHLNPGIPEMDFGRARFRQSKRETNKYTTKDE